MIQRLELYERTGVPCLAVAARRPRSFSHRVDVSNINGDSRRVEYDAANIDHAAHDLGTGTLMMDHLAPTRANDQVVLNRRNLEIVRKLVREINRFGGR